MSMTPSKLTHRFVNSNRRTAWSVEEQEWLRGVFGAILKVSRSSDAFTVDAVWEQIDILQRKGKIKSSATDHRILGPMLRFMVKEGIISSSGYYTKSTRRGGGSRPVTVWKSHIKTLAKSKA